MTDLWVTLGVGALVLACIWFLRPSPPVECDDATKPLVIECVAHGGGNCIEQVQKLNGCVFQ